MTGVSNLDDTISMQFTTKLRQRIGLSLSAIHYLAPFGRSHLCQTPFTLRFCQSSDPESNRERVKLLSEEPQNTETFPGAYKRIEFLPILNNGYSSDKQQRVLDTLVGIAESEECAKAFASAGLKSVKDLILGGLVVGSSSFLRDPDYNSTSGITEAARQLNLGAVGSTAAQGFTIRDILDDPRLGVQTNDGRARIFLNASAFGGGVLSLREVLVHELIHVAGKRGKDPSTIGAFFGEDDLSWFSPFYKNLLKACR